MPVIHQQKILPYSAKQMYDLVNDVAKYPEFLPFCTEAQILCASEKELSAVLHIQKGPLQICFSTQNKLSPFDQIDMTLLDGPFQYLHGNWVFKGEDKSCEINLTLDFEMKSTLLKLTLGPLFSSLAHNMVNVFSKRAEQIYD